MSEQFKISFEVNGVNHLQNNATWARVTLHAFDGKNEYTICRTAVTRPSAKDADKASDVIGERVALAKARKKALKQLARDIANESLKRVQQVKLDVLRCQKVDKMIDFENRYIAQY